MIIMCKALTRLEVGQLAVLRFGEETEVVHPFGTNFSDESGAQVVYPPLPPSAPVTTRGPVACWGKYTPLAA